MKKKLKFIYFMLFVSVISFAQNNLPKLEKGWELGGFDTPESVTYDSKNKVLYVSNVNGELGAKDGNGYISKVSIDGKIIEQKWITGLNGPKGITIHNERLYIADIDEIIEVDIKTSKKTVYKAEGATFLNDPVVTSNGDVYVTNTFGMSSIFKLHKGKVELWLNDAKLNGPNGIIVKGNELYVNSWGDNPAEDFSTKIPGKLMKINLKTKEINDITKPIGNLDGFVELSAGFLLSDWIKGDILFYSNKTKETSSLVNVGKGVADIGYDSKGKMIFAPIMLEGKVIMYKIIN